MGILTTVAEELVKKGHKVEGLVSPKVASDIDALAKRATVAGFDSKALTRTENLAIKTATESFLNGLKKADGTISRATLIDLQQAYGKALVKEFGDGPQAKAALTVFQESVSNVWTQQRALARGTDVASAAPSVARVDARVTAAVEAAPAGRAAPPVLTQVVTPAAEANRAAAQAVIQPDAIRRSGAVPTGSATATPAPRPAQGGQVAATSGPAPASSTANITPAGPPVQVADEVVPPADGFSPSGRRTGRADDVVDVQARDVSQADAGNAVPPSRPPAAAGDNSITPEPGDFYQTRGSNGAPPAQPPAPAAAQAPQPPGPAVAGGVDDNQTAAEKAARARVAAEDAIKFRDATFASRTSIAEGVREFDQGGFAEKQAAFDKIASKIEGSGLLVRPGSAEEAATMAKTGATGNRSIEEVKGILLTRPGYDTNGQFINGVIKVSEWDALRKAMRGDILKAETQEIFSRLDQARIGNRRIDTVTADTKRLREIMLDADFNPAPRVGDDGRVVAGSDRMTMAGRAAANEGKPRASYSAIEGDLRNGHPVSPAEIDRLAVHYRRFYASAADQAADAAPAGRVGQVVDAVARGTRAVFNPVDRHLDRVPFVPRLAPTVALTAGTILGTGALSVPVTYFAPDNEIPIMGEMGRRVAANLPFGFGGNVEGASWLPEIYFSKMEGDPEYRAQVLEGDTTKMNASKLLARAAQEQKTAEQAKQGGELEQQRREAAVKTTAADAVAGIQSLGSGSIEAGAKVEDVDAVVMGMAAGNSAMMSIDQMTKLATVIAEASRSSGAVDILSPQEYASVKQNPAFTRLPENARKQLDAALAPLMPKP